MLVEAIIMVMRSFIDTYLLLAMVHSFTFGKIYGKGIDPLASNTSHPSLIHVGRFPLVFSHLIYLILGIQFL